MGSEDTLPITLLERKRYLYFLTDTKEARLHASRSQAGAVTISSNA
jgi:hypothetical protein